MSKFVHKFQYAYLQLITFDTVEAKNSFNGSTS